jgi:multiple antibiotic resistance protein
MVKDILMAFIPLFVAVDAFGTLPIFVGLTEGFNDKEKSRIIIQSTWTASIVAVLFVLAGKMIFKFLGITIADFMIAGGAILFCISITDIISSAGVKRSPYNGMGAVPLGVPLIAGPAVLTTSMVIESQYGLFATVVSILLNILIAAAIFNLSNRIITILGSQGTRALSKVMSLLLAAIAVMLIRHGIQQFLN